MFPGLNETERGFMRNIIEEAANDHDQIPIPKCHWAYKTEPTSTRIDDYAREFMYIVPYCFAKWSSSEALSRGLLESIEFRQDDNYLSGLRLNFDNG